MPSLLCLHSPAASNPTTASNRRAQGILINGQFPGPRIDCVTNDNLLVTVVNNLDEPFLLTWNGIKQRKNSWQDGVAGTNCPIPPGANYTYKLQAKDQIGTFTYFPSLALHRAAGGFGALNVYQRPAIPVPYPPPAGDFTLLVGDWYRAGHRQLRQSLDAGAPLPPPDGLLPCPRAGACTSSLPGCISASARTSSPSSYCDTIAGNLFDQIPCLPCFIQLVSLG